MLRNTRLTAELQARLEQISCQANEIRTSRQRIVAAQDAERRRLERDIHDGAQQHLVALAVKLNLAKTMAKRKPEKANDVVDQLGKEMDDALRTLDELARGIYPPLLEREGIAAALRARTATAPLDVAIEDRTTMRFAPEVELAVYFCILEALQNTTKYAQAARAVVTLESDHDGLTFSASDDGVGFDPATTPQGSGTQGMSDRLATIGGTIEVASVPGAGTTVTGTIPLRERVPA